MVEEYDGRKAAATMGRACHQDHRAGDKVAMRLTTPDDEAPGCVEFEWRVENTANSWLHRSHTVRNRDELAAFIGEFTGGYLR